MNALIHRDEGALSPRKRGCRADAAEYCGGDGGDGLAPAARYWTIPEYAAVLQVSRDAVGRLLRAGKVPGAWKAGREWRIPREAAASDLEGMMRRVIREEMRALFIGFFNSQG